MQDTSLGQRIRNLRLQKGFTQIELAKGICTPSMISQIESDRARPSFKVLNGVAERLEVPLEKLLSNVDMHLDVVSNYKMARAMVASGEYTSAIPLLNGLSEASHGQLSISEVLYDLGVCYLKTNQLEAADQTFDQVFELAVLRQDRHLAARVLWNSGVLELYRKKNQLAVYKLEKALREADGIKEVDVMLTGSILYDLGRAHTQCGEPDKAVSSYEEAGKYLETASNVRDLAHLYFELSKSYKQLGDFEKAIAYSDRATVLFAGMENLILKTKIECETAVLLGEEGQHTSAIEMLQTGRAQFLDFGEREEAGTVCLMIGKFQVLSGELEGAQESCEQARLLLPDIPLQRGRIWNLAGQIALKKNDRDEAITCFEKAADLLQKADVFSAWEAVIRELAELYDEVQDSKRAFELMDAARKMAQIEMRRRGISL